jgi:hypothetical protein
MTTTREDITALTEIVHLPDPKFYYRVDAADDSRVRVKVCKIGAGRREPGGYDVIELSMETGAAECEVWGAMTAAERVAAAINRVGRAFNEQYRAQQMTEAMRTHLGVYSHEGVKQR